MTDSPSEFEKDMEGLADGGADDGITGITGIQDGGADGGADGDAASEAPAADVDPEEAFGGASES